MPTSARLRTRPLRDPGASPARVRPLSSAAPAALVPLLLLLFFRGCGTSTPSPSGGQPGGPGCMLHGACTTSSDCCSRVCTSGECACGQLGSSCAGDDDCCSSWACLKGTCTFACRADGSHCAEDSECCGGACLANVCGPPRCLNAGETCLYGGCCDGLSCVKEPDAGSASYGTCQPGCSDFGGTCGFGPSGTPCCSGFGCDNGFCIGQCRGLGLRCTDDSQCCDGYACRAGACQACHGPGIPCKADGDCCAGTCGDTGMCACQAMGESCGPGAPCCAGFACHAGVCACSARGAACAADSDCCNGLECAGGKCEMLGCFPYGMSCKPGTGATECCDTCGSNGRCCTSSGMGCSATTPCCDATDRCISGACVACAGAGGKCASDADCCGGHCEGGTCCTATKGVLCGLAVGGNSPCCAGLECDTPQSVCCLGAGGACSVDSDCCTGVTGWGCHAGHCCAMPVPYANCQSDADCCAGSQCQLSPGAIGQCCLPSGAACTAGVSMCCSGQCTGGACP